MNLFEINSALAKVQLPALDQHQVDLINHAGEMEAFDRAISRIHANDLAAQNYLELVARSLAPSVRSTLKLLEIEFLPAAVIRAAKREKMQLFGALHAIRSEKTNKAEAISYIRSLDLGGVQATRPKVSSDGQSGAEPPYYSFKIFSQAAALCVSEARTRAGNDHTVQIEGALPFSDGSRKFDWQGKITVQLTTQEMTLLLAVLKRLVTSVKFEGHGRHHDKVFSIDYQETHFFVRLIQRGRPAISVPVRPVDAISVISLIYKQMKLNSPHLSVDEINSMVADIGAMTR